MDTNIGLIAYSQGELWSLNVCTVFKWLMICIFTKALVPLKRQLTLTHAYTNHHWQSGMLNSLLLYALHSH